MKTKQHITTTRAWMAWVVLVLFALLFLTGCQTDHVVTKGPIQWRKHRPGVAFNLRKRPAVKTASVVDEVVIEHRTSDQPSTTPALTSEVRPVPIASKEHQPHPTEVKLISTPHKKPWKFNFVRGKVNKEPFPYEQAPKQVSKPTFHRVMATIAYVAAWIAIATTAVIFCFVLIDFILGSIILYTTYMIALDTVIGAMLLSMSSTLIERFVAGSKKTQGIELDPKTNAFAKKAMFYALTTIGCVVLSFLMVLFAAVLAMLPIIW